MKQKGSDWAKWRLRHAGHGDCKIDWEIGKLYKIDTFIGNRKITFVLENYDDEDPKRYKKVQVFDKGNGTILLYLGDKEKEKDLEFTFEENKKLFLIENKVYSFGGACCKKNFKRIGNK